MYIFLTKKLSPWPAGAGAGAGAGADASAPAPAPALSSLAWAGGGGWLAVGGAGGRLRTLRLAGGAVTAATAVAASEALAGHSAAAPVCRLHWNGAGRLVSADASGLVIVWLRAGSGWVEEMGSDRGRGAVAAVRWRGDGGAVLVAGADGGVLAGSVAGDRLWAVEARRPLTAAAWSPDGSSLLLAGGDGAVDVHGARSGARVAALPAPALRDLPAGARVPPVAAVEWHGGAPAYPDTPTLAVAFVNGRVQLMREVDDAKPVILDTGLRLALCRWSGDGGVLAVAGTRAGAGAAGATGDVSEVQFYSPFGAFLFSLRVPGGAVAALDWEPGGLRLAMAVDTYVYVANVRPAYTWCCFGPCIAYAYAASNGGARVVAFWNTETGERHTTPAPRLIAMHGAGAHCVLVSGCESDADAEAAAAAPTAACDDAYAAPAAAGVRGVPRCAQYALALCDALGSPLLTKYVAVRPDCVAMSATHVAVASADAVFVWHYEAAVAAAAAAAAAAAGAGAGDAAPVPAPAPAPAAGPAGDERSLQLAGGDGADADAICALAVSAKYLLVARESGAVLLFALPSLAPAHTLQLRCRPVTVRFNCDSSRFSIIDGAAVLTIFDLDMRGVDALGAPTQGVHLPFERRDVWQVVWADDAPELAAVMEKTRMYIFRGVDPEEPTSSSGYLCRFDNLTTTSVLLDDLLAAPERPDRASMVLRHETRALRDTRMLLARTVSLRDSAQFIEDNAHPRLWRLLAETAMDKLDFATAEKAFVSCQDYPGAQFVKRLQRLRDASWQRAEVLAFLGRPDEGEAVLLGMGRRDLAIDLRARAGAWMHVLRLLADGGGGGDAAQLAEARARLGDYFADRQEYAWAIPCYEASGDQGHEALVECYHRVEDFDALARLAEALPARSPLLANIGAKLASVGLPDGAARAYTRGGDIDAAVDCCVAQGLWDRALELADAHALPQVDALLAQHAARLSAGGRVPAAVDLLRRTRRRADGARLLATAAAAAAAAAAAPAPAPAPPHAPPLRAKRLFVCAAREADAAAASAGLPPDDSVWHGAEALHYLALAQRALLAGDSRAALTAAVRADRYQAGAGAQPRTTAAILALAAAHAGAYAACSHGLARLQALTEAAAAATAGRGGDGSIDGAAAAAAAAAAAPALADLAVAIFSRTRPLDPPLADADAVRCPGTACGASLRPWATDCLRCGSRFPACVATGRPLFEAHDRAPPAALAASIWRCAACRRLALRSAVAARASCPLCHAAVTH